MKVPATDRNSTQASADYLQMSQSLAIELGQLLQANCAEVTTAESCTGGLIAAALTDVSGSSTWFRQGVVTYSNTAKSQLLDVPSDLFEKYGAVSEACVRAMVSGAAKHSGATVAIAVSGIAGPDGGSADKPVGTVWLAWAVGSDISAEQFLFDGDRRSVREQAVICALHGTIARIQGTECFPS